MNQINKIFKKFIALLASIFFFNKNIEGAALFIPEIKAIVLDF